MPVIAKKDRYDLLEIDRVVFLNDLHSLIRLLADREEPLAPASLVGETMTFVDRFIQSYDYDISQFRHYFYDYGIQHSGAVMGVHLDPYRMLEYTAYDGSRRTERLANCISSKIVKGAEDATIVHLFDNTAPVTELSPEIGIWVKPLHRFLMTGFDSSRVLDLPFGFSGQIADIRRKLCSDEADIRKRITSEGLKLDLPDKWFSSLSLSTDYKTLKDGVSISTTSAASAQNVNFKSVSWVYNGRKTPDSIKQLLPIINTPTTVCNVQFNEEFVAPFDVKELVGVDTPVISTRRRRAVTI